jgi:colanic acid/amylovoran biosynthesis protein
MLQNEQHVCLMGATTEVGNRGVAALAASLVKLVSGADGETPVCFLLPAQTRKPLTFTIAGQERTVPVINLRISPKAPLSQQLAWILVLSFLYRMLPLGFLRRQIAKNTWVQTVLNAKFVGDIRGGDSFSDIYGWRRLIIGSLPLVAVYWLRGGYVLFPQTYGPFKGRIAKMFARYILNRASVILARDKASMKLVEELTNGCRQAQFSPDVAFTLDSRLPSQPGIEPPLPVKMEEPLIGVNVNGLMFNGGYTRSNMFGLKLNYQEYLVSLITALAQKHNARILLVPHTFSPRESVESDPGACERVREQLPPEILSRVHLVNRTYNQHEIKGIISLCEFFVGSRMHACIAALSQGIPAVGVAYSKKFVGVFETVGAEDWIVDGREFEAPAAVARTLELFENRRGLQNRLKVAVTNAQEQLRVVFGNLLEGRGERSPQGIGKFENQPIKRKPTAAEAQVR